jgi:hypothetical protein
MQDCIGWCVEEHCLTGRAARKTQGGRRIGWETWEEANKSTTYAVYCEHLVMGIIGFAEVWMQTWERRWNQV